MVDTVGQNVLGNYLKIYSHNSVYSNLSEQSAMWKNVLKKRKGPAGGRELRYLLRSAFGAAASQFVGVNGAVNYPGASQATINEGKGEFKDFAVTIEVERTLISKAIDDFRRYGEPLAEELKSKTISFARMLSATAYQDGTGIIGDIFSGGTTPVISAGRVTVTLGTDNDDRSHVGWFEFGDHLLIQDVDGSEHNYSTTASGSGATTAYYQVEDKDRANDKIVLSARDSAGVELVINGANDVTDTDLFRRKGTTAVDTTAAGIAAGTTDYGSLSEAYLGLESLTNDDNRLVNGINLTGAIKGSRFDAGGDALDSQDFQAIMSQIKINVGEGRYKWNDAIMAPESLDTLVESRETDRRFHSIQDTDRGVPRLGYVHGNDRLVFMSDEYCQKKRVWICPQADVLQYHGSDFEFVRPEGGQRFFLRPNTSGGHFRQVRAYMEGSGLLICIHPAACGAIENFTF
jgi:hypothetical protein